MHRVKRSRRWPKQQVRLLWLADAPDRVRVQLTNGLGQRYDTQGRVSERTELNAGQAQGQAQGQPKWGQRYRYDGVGRLLEVLAVPYRNGQAQTPQWQERYGWGSDPTQLQPLRIERPSVVPGQVHSIELAYNDAGQITRVTERGFSPLDSTGQLARQTQTQASTATTNATALTRSTSYTWQRIAGLSLLTHIDGPLPNGPDASPQDSDITRIQWDAQGRFITAVTAPGGRTNTLAYDAAGRVQSVRNEVGQRTSFVLGPQHQLLQVTQFTQNQGTNDSGNNNSNPRSQSWRYNALGQATESGSGALYESDAGTSRSNNAADAYRPQWAQHLNIAGQSLWQASALGVLRQTAYDTEGRPIQAGVYSSAIAKTVQLTYDRLGLNTDAQPATRAVPANSPLGPLQLVDDFGRNVLTLSPDSGATRRSFDEADRLVRMTDAMGNQASYAHDAQGRILKQTVTDQSTQKSTTTEWRYSPRHLLEVIHPNQRERFEMDARGLRTARIVTLNTPQGEHTAVTRYEHDEAGQLVASTLPDGSRLVYARNGQGQVVALKRQTLQTPWLRWLGSEQTLASGFERDLVGIKGYTSGNGVQAQFQRSAQGDLARVVYRHTAARPTQHAQRTTATQLLGRSTQETIERLLGIAPAHAQTVPDIATPSATAAMGNTLPGALGLPTDPQALMDHRYLWSPQGLLLHSQQRAGNLAEQTQHSHAYDARSRLVASVQAGVQADAKANAGNSEAASTEQAVWRYAYGPSQRRVLSQQGVASQSDISTGTRRSQFQPGSHRLNLGQDTNTDTSYTPNGQPARVGQREYVWDALGRLTEVRQENTSLASYSYDHRGLRISKISNAGNKASSTNTTHTLYDSARQPLAELDAQGRIQRQYIWLADLPLAVIDNPATLTPEDPGLAQVFKDLATAVRSWLNTEAGLAWLHTNHLGAPEAATNERGQLIWRASYAPFGAAKVVAADASNSAKGALFQLHLRLPGQIFDPETGLHYNRQRYYDPELGQYLTPDPLGTPDGPNPYAYVAFNPLANIDPDGLILFAFDGTNNSNPPPGQDTFSNVYKFFLAYDVSDPLSGNGDKAWYMNGVGRDDPDSKIKANLTDAADGNTSRARVDYMLNQLDAYVKDLTFKPGQKVNIDMVGFSRGAAMARDFSNRVEEWIDQDRWGKKTNCVELRYLGLWDTVAQFGLNGADNGNWQLAVPASVRNVFHAVAMNENRYLFPGEAIGRGIQRGFVGMHADIGGSYGTGDISDVALNWMVEQAKASGVKMVAWGDNKTDVEWARVTNPVVHGKGADILDSDFCLRQNNERWADNCTLRKDSNPGGLTTKQIADLGFITYRDDLGKDADGSTPIIGTVNMEKYAKWLKENYNLNIAAGP